MLWTFINILDVLNLDIIMSTTPLECLHCIICVICNLNRFNSSILILSLMTVHNVKMCIEDTGTPEQSLVLL